jgi:hypothetical protein
MNLQKKKLSSLDHVPSRSIAKSLPSLATTWVGMEYTGL